MPIENVLTISGRGTVVTGAIERGTLRVGEQVEVVGLGDTLTTVATGLETFGKSLPSAQAGDNAAILLRGVKRDQVQRGQVVARPGTVTPHARFTARLTLGYRDAVATSDSSMHAAGTRVVGHEFHRTQTTFRQAYEPAWRFRRGPAEIVADGAVHAGVHAGYLHAHAAAHPRAATRFVAAAATSKLAG